MTAIPAGRNFRRGNRPDVPEVVDGFERTTKQIAQLDNGDSRF